MTPHIGPEVEASLHWDDVISAIADGHRLPPPQVDDTIFRRGGDTMLSRAAWIDGLGLAVKTATVFPGNVADGVPTINGSVTLFADRSGVPEATLDFHLVTKWKTAADSALAASRLARPDAAHILIVGSGAVAESMVDAYRSVFRDSTIAIWSRDRSHAAALAEQTGCTAVDDLEGAVRAADVVCTATMATDPVVLGGWLRPGQHLDLIGGYRADMREVDDEAIERSEVFADCTETALDVGDIADPVASGLLDPRAMLDFRSLDAGFARSSPDAITMCKNAGGAHLDLMVARCIYERSRSAA